MSKYCKIVGLQIAASFQYKNCQLRGMRLDVAYNAHREGHVTLAKILFIMFYVILPLTTRW